jgi:aryl-alcohol dehydrogenase-like predicted oxidoreductase
VDGRPHGWADITAEAVGLVHYARDRGILFFDKAAAHGHGRSETLLGQALASSAAGRSAVVCTKVSLLSVESAQSCPGSGLKAQAEGSLRRLQRDHIDVLLLHGPPDA